MYGIPGDWTVHEILSGYIDCDSLQKSIIHFRTAYGEIKWNFQVLFFEFHLYHYYANSFDIMAYNFTHLLILKAGDSKKLPPKL